MAILKQKILRKELRKRRKRRGHALDGVIHFEWKAKLLLFSVIGQRVILNYST